MYHYIIIVVGINSNSNGSCNLPNLINIKVISFDLRKFKFREIEQLIWDRLHRDYCKQNHIKESN